MGEDVPWKQRGWFSAALLWASTTPGAFLYPGKNGVYVIALRARVLFPIFVSDRHLNSTFVLITPMHVDNSFCR